MRNDTGGFWPRMIQRPRALLVSPVTPNPNGSGPAQRAHQWVHALAAEHEVDVLVVHRRAMPGGIATEALCRIASFHELTPAPSRATYWPRAAEAILASALGKRRFAFVGWGREWTFLTRAARARLAEWYVGVQWARVVGFRMQVFDYVEHLASASVSRDDVLIDFDDVESTTRRSIAEGLVRRQRWREAALTRLDAAYAAKVERRIVEVFPRVAVCSAADRACLEQRLPNAQPEVFPNRLAKLPPRIPLVDAPNILFVGTLGYFPNEESVRFLVDAVLPLLRHEDTRWKLTVVGYAAPRRLARWLDRQQGVEWRGAVENLVAAYRDAGIVAAPVFSGGGTKLKVLEALAYARPLVATSHAVRGLSLRPTRDFWPAETPTEWVDAFRRLATERALAAELGASGREAVRENYVYGDAT
jgi:glycosyltransferase involved in cell wall biosynthesis